MVESKFSTNLHLAPYHTAAGSCRRGAWRQEPGSGGRVFFIFFSFSFLKHL
jgi:hypothetical protein